MELELVRIPGLFAVCRLPADAPLPAWATAGELWSISRTPEELSVVCSEAQVPTTVRREGGWRALRVAGSLDFSEVGILEGLARPLAAAGISIFALSTFDTDYLLYPAEEGPKVEVALARAGHRFRS